MSLAKSGGRFKKQTLRLPELLTLMFVCQQKHLAGPQGTMKLDRLAGQRDTYIGPQGLFMDSPYTGLAEGYLQYM